MLSICPLGRPSVHLSVHVRHVVYLSAGLSICCSVSICPSCLFVRLAVHLSTCQYMSVMLSICLLSRPRSVRLSVHIRHVVHLSPGPSICPSVSTCPSCCQLVPWAVHLSVCQYMSVMLSICLLSRPRSVRLSVHIRHVVHFIPWAVHLSVCQYMSVMSICPLDRPSVHLSVCVSHVVYLSVEPSICLSVSCGNSTSANVFLKFMLLKLVNI